MTDLTPEWREKSAGIFVSDAFPNAAIYRLKFGGYRYQIGGQESATYGQFTACERDLIIALKRVDGMRKL